MKVKIIAVMLLTSVLTGCGFYTVPPAAKGKILSTSGYSVDVKETGKYLLWGRDEMVVLDTSTQVMSEPLAVKMQDSMTLNFSVRFRTRISGSDNVINAMFNDITHDNYQVSLQKVYGVYGKDVVQSVARSVVGKYNTEEVAVNFDKITQDLHKELTARMKNSPLEVSNITLANIDYPDVIDKAIEAQQERKLAIETESNQQAIEMVKKTNELDLAKADYEIRMTRARALRDENKTTAEGLNSMLLEYRKLEVMEAMTKNSNAVFVPFEAMGSAGLSNRVFSK
jgi:regulator of protease activity HflC (stomatin/prohibitin superfamily)